MNLINPFEWFLQKLDHRFSSQWFFNNIKPNELNRLAGGDSAAEYYSKKIVKQPIRQTMSRNEC